MAHYVICSFETIKNLTLAPITVRCAPRGFKLCEPTCFDMRNDTGNTHYIVGIGEDDEIMGFYLPMDRICIAQEAGEYGGRKIYDLVSCDSKKAVLIPVDDDAML